jgi:3'(2'), 5'-bisphosphate nucleotidase
MDDVDLVGLATSIAQRAGAIVVELRQRGLFVTEKADKSILTNADQASERFIAAQLRKATPGIPIISEEENSGKSGEAPFRFWLVDPLDGTREFTAGLDEFTINIALVVDGQSKLGVVAAPGTGELYAGHLGVGAWKVADEDMHPIHVRQRPPAGSIALVSRHDAEDPALAPMLRPEQADRVVKMGSGLKFCRIAEGSADVYPRPGHTMEWDTAAPQVILEAAGGSVQTADGHSLRYGKPGWINPSFVCRGAHP